MLKIHIESTFFYVDKGEIMFKNLLKLIAKLSLKVTSTSINRGCTFIIYQPELPEGADKFRKF